MELLKKDQLVNDPCEVGDDDTSVVGMQLFIMGVVYRVSTCVFMHARPSVAPSSQRAIYGLRWIVFSPILPEIQIAHELDLVIPHAMYTLHELINFNYTNVISKF